MASTFLNLDISESGCSVESDNFNGREIEEAEKASSIQEEVEVEARESCRSASGRTRKWADNRR